MGGGYTPGTPKNWGCGWLDIRGAYTPDITVSYPHGLWRAPKTLSVR